jgi:hypothetical protein
MPVSPPTAGPSLAVIVPATDDPPTLPDCLAAVRSSAGEEPELIVQRTPAAAGPARARNLAAERAAAEVLVFVDSDVELHPDALERLRAAFAADAELAAVFGSYDDSPAAPGVVAQFRNLLHHHVHTESAGEAETFWAGLGAVRREAFLAAGGFDGERYPEPAIEDIELGRRLRARGERIVLDPGVLGTHLKRWSLAGMVCTDLLRRGVPWTRLQLEERRLAGSLNLGPRQRASAVAALVATLAALRRRPRTALAALGVMVALNLRLYALLARRGGPRLALAGVALHLVHQLTAIAAVPIAALAHARAGFPRADAPR